MDLLETQDVVKQYANHLALDGVSIQVPEGRIFGLLGPNGAGKTTLIRIINRITAPDSGTVRFDGHLSRPEDVYQIGYLPEERGLYKKMKVGEQAIYLAQLKGLSYAEAKKRLQYWFEKFEIMEWWNRKLEELSKGMQQKVQFIITVIHEPKLLILDEPFSGFDPVNAERLKQEILELKEKGHTIFRTHRYQIRLQTSEALPKLESPLFSEQARTAEGEGIYNICIAKLPEASNSELLRALGERYEILSFAEEIPSMHDIFIQVVENNPLKTE